MNVWVMCEYVSIHEYTSVCVRAQSCTLVCVYMCMYMHYDYVFLCVYV